ncbi:hypothetical protein [Jannaschia seosinensis]|uniref:hypothetical protein n=1 Tax=Jannaschia seosinensis TaxID=313367 RepID=UPI0009F9BBDC|nr:hypothetical protein [Jannaschia seosinensis]
MGSPCWGAPARAHAPRLKRISRPEGTIPKKTRIIVTLPASCPRKGLLLLLFDALAPPKTA